MYGVSITFASKRRQCNASSQNMGVIGGVSRGYLYPHVIEWVSFNKNGRSKIKRLIILVFGNEKYTNFLFL